MNRSFWGSTVNPEQRKNPLIPKDMPITTMLNQAKLAENRKQYAIAGDYIVAAAKALQKAAEHKAPMHIRTMPGEISPGTYNYYKHNMEQAMKLFKKGAELYIKESISSPKDITLNMLAGESLAHRRKIALEFGIEKDGVLEKAEMLEFNKVVNKVLKSSEKLYEGDMRMAERAIKNSLEFECDAITKAEKLKKYISLIELEKERFHTSDAAEKWIRDNKIRRLSAQLKETEAFISFGKSLFKK